MVQRLYTTKEALLRLLTVAYMVVVFPMLLFVGIVLFWSINSDHARGVGPDAVPGAILVWALILASVGKFIYGRLRRRGQLKRIVGALRDPAYFDPTEGYFGYQESAGKYLGIDTQNGTILYVHRIRKGQVDVLAMAMEDWTNREVEGSVFRLYTKIPELPRIEISHPWAQRWFDTLGAMEHKQYSAAPWFKQHVRERLSDLEREHSVQIPRLA